MLRSTVTDFKVTAAKPKLQKILRQLIVACLRGLPSDISIAVMPRDHRSLWKDIEGWIRGHILVTTYYIHLTSLSLTSAVSLSFGLTGQFLQISCIQLLPVSRVSQLLGNKIPCNELKILLCQHISQRLFIYRHWLLQFVVTHRNRNLHVNIEL